MHHYVFKIPSKHIYHRSRYNSPILRPKRKQPQSQSIDIGSKLKPFPKI